MSNEVTTYTPRPRNAMVIKNLCPGLVEMGKIKIGNKGAIRKSGSGNDWQAPQKLDHFLITTNERGADNNFVLDSSLHKIFGEAPKSIKVMLIYDDISLNLATRYICYYGKTVFCSGDGEEAQQLQKDGTHKATTCPCYRQDPKFAGDVDAKGVLKPGAGKCKINGILSVIIDGAETVGGVWKFRTTSYNTVVGLLSSLALIQRITGGRLAGIPMNMVVSPKTVADPINQKQQTIYVVSLVYAGTMNSLREVGYEIAMIEAKHGISMKMIEQDAMLMLQHKPTAGTSFGTDIDADVVDEFYPEDAQRAETATLVQPTKDTTGPQATTAGTPAGSGGATTAPGLVAPLKEDTVIEGIEEGESLDQETGEVTEEPAAEVQQAPVREHGKPSPGKQRRTKEEVEEDRLADVAAAEVAQQSTGITGPLEEDDGFPGLPGSRQQEEQPPHPADDEKVAETTAGAPTTPTPAATTAAGPAPCGDLF